MAGGSLRQLGPRCVRAVAVPSACLELHELHGDLDHQPVVAAQVEAGELADPAQPLAQRVRVDVERLGGRADVAAPAQELLERLQERGRALAVVVGDARDRVAVRVADAAVEATCAGGTCTGRAPRRPSRRASPGGRSCRAARGGPPRTPAAKLAAPRQTFERPIATGASSSSCSARTLASSALLAVGGTRRSARSESSRRSKSEPGSSRREGALELVGGRRGGEHDVALVEVAAEPRRPALEPGERLAAGELLEEVLDQVLLGQALDQLDLLERDGGLVGDGAREVDLRTCPSATSRPSSSSFATSGTATRGRAAAAGELRAELGEADLGAGLAGARRGGAQVRAPRTPGRAGRRGRPRRAGASARARRRRAAARRASRPRRSISPSSVSCSSSSTRRRISS